MDNKTIMHLNGILLLLGAASCIDINPELIMPGGHRAALPSDGVYGNDVSSRTGQLDTTNNPLTWIDTGVSLPAGALRKWYVYANHSNTVMTSRLRLQIWRPTPGTYDLILVWERRAMIDLTYPDGALYVFDTSGPEHTHAIQTGDRLGWTSENSLFPLSMGNVEYGRAVYREVVHGSYPTIGGTYVFDGPAFPFIFSSAVSVATGMNDAPEVIGMLPIRGPVGGGTRVTVSGRSLATPERVLLGTEERIECSIVNGSRTDHFIFETPLVQIASLQDKPIVVLIKWPGSGAVVKTNLTFTYKPNPTITDIFPLKTIPVGGTTITIAGKSMDAVHSPMLQANLVFTQPMIALTHVDVYYEEVCSPQNYDILLCPTPTLTKAAESALIKATRPLGTSADGSLAARLYIGLRLDGVKTYRNISATPGLADKGQVMLFSNPEFSERQIFKFQKGITLDIQGKHLRAGIGASDYKVEVGTATCVIRDLTAGTLHCTPPQERPETKYSNSLAYVYDLTIRIGKYKQHVVGEVHYPRINLLLIIIPSVLGLLLIIAVIVIIITCRKRSRSRKAKVRSRKMEGGCNDDETEAKYDMHRIIDLPPIKREY